MRSQNRYDRQSFTAVMAFLASFHLRGAHLNVSIIFTSRPSAGGAEVGLGLTNLAPPSAAALRKQRAPLPGNAGFGFLDLWFQPFIHDALHFLLRT